MLLKPWRDIRRLKEQEQIWENALESFLAGATPDIHRIISNVQFFHRATDMANARKAGLHVSDSARGDAAQVDMWPSERLSESTREVADFSIVKKNGREEQHALEAMLIAKGHGIFTDQPATGSQSFNGDGVRHGCSDDIRKLALWHSEMAAIIAAQNAEGRTLSGDVAQPGLVSASTSLVSNVPLAPAVHSISMAEKRKEPQGLDPDKLNQEQRMCYDIVTSHLEQTLANEAVRPLRLFIYGEGGSGKSRVIQAITERFQQVGKTAWLLKAAYTGIAASLIGGKTTHSIAMVSKFENRQVSDETRKKLQEFWSPYRYLIIDEISMLSKKFLAILERNIGIGKAGSSTGGDDISFGGLNVIICGDFHQFPPVATATRDALFYPSRPSDADGLKIGRTLYEEFSMVVVLTKQLRITDPVWREFLSSLRKGEVRPEHLTMLKGLVLGHELCPVTDFNQEPWWSAVLITPRHAVRNQWNDHALTKHCASTGNPIFLCRADDTIKGKSLSPVERLAFEKRNTGRSGGRDGGTDLPDCIKLAVGMPVLLTQNLETDLDITNGANGCIVEIVLHPDDHDQGNDQFVHLRRLPLYVLVEMRHTRAGTLTGLKPRVIPIQPASQTARIRVSATGNTEICRTVVRKQFPITPAYAFTDHRAQGQTIPCAIADIAPPATGGLSLFNIYVTLSRVPSRQCIRLLRTFPDDMLLNKSFPIELNEEEDRICRLGRITYAMYNDTSGSA